MSIGYRSTAILFGGLLTACPSQPVPGDTETDGTATDTSSGSETTSNETTPTTGEPTTTGSTTGDTTTEGDSSTTEGVSATTTEETTSTSTGEETTSTSTGEDTTSTSTGEDTTSTSTGEDTSTSTGEDTSSTSETGGDPPECGDGVVEAPEECDDGNNEPDDGCLADCKIGMGVPVGPVELPDPDGAEDLCCIVPLPGWFLDQSGAIVARTAQDAGPEGQEAAHLFQIALPSGNDPAFWDIVEWAGEHGRLPLQAGSPPGESRMFVAGLVDTEAQMPGSGGHLWLANAHGDGSTEFLHDFEDLPVAPTDLAVNGDIAVVGNHAAGEPGAWVLRFDGSGALMWQHDAPVGVGWSIRYRGVAIDAEGVIYAVGERHADDSSSDQLFIEALSPAGVVLWEVTQASPTHMHALPSDVIVTADGALAVVMSQFDADVLEDSILGYARFTADAGAQTWWKDWTPPDGWSVRAGPADVEPFGGLFVGVGEHEGGMSRTRVFRIDKDGAVLWATKQPGGDVRDLLFFGPPERIYAVTKDAILQYDSW
ncbi:DUF4215 domain-containing protein [Nannocystis radixulma]|uniref:DUF4215 domain-containing protein n=1 Tax=Nannocystis radixulma TaxID=2995305 RepID=A0ABT5AXC3_9BACT|nr:DUF4215 domain-containing protein [Nannocystis radixulma]MDC0666492.1 DUF4215 domain-containing protein [Nannocystis radixulma]